MWWRCMCSAHSIDGDSVVWEITGRIEENISQRIIKNKISAEKDSIDPIDETVFHLVKKSG